MAEDAGVGVGFSAGAGALLENNFPSGAGANVEVTESDGAFSPDGA